MLEDMEGSKIAYSKSASRSGDNKLFYFNGSESISSFYLRLINELISVKVTKSNIKEFKGQIDRLVKKKAQNLAYKKKKEYILKMPEYCMMEWI